MYVNLLDGKTCKTFLQPKRRCILKRASDFYEVKLRLNADVECKLRI